MAHGCAYGIVDGMVLATRVMNLTFLCHVMKLHSQSHNWRQF